MSEGFHPLTKATAWAVLWTVFWAAGFVLNETEATGVPYTEEAARVTGAFAVLGVSTAVLAQAFRLALFLSNRR